MRKKHRVKHKKKAKADTSEINEVTLARLEAAKSKRQKTIAMVKHRLDEKFNRRMALTRANTLIDERKAEGLLDGEKKPSVEETMAKIRAEMKSVLVAGVKNVHSSRVLREKIKYDAKTTTMMIFGKKYKLKKNVHAIGWGREALMMSTSLEAMIGDNLRKGFVVLPPGTIASMSIYPEWFPRLDTRINFTEAQADPTPDDVCVRATRNIVDYCKKLKKKDILIVLLSRGSDDLMCLPRGTVGLAEKMLVLEQLRAAGATTREIEIVRKALSAVRGGRLASLSHPAKVISLVMSDLGGDETHLESIAGGPTIKTDHRALLTSSRSILDKYALDDHKLSQGVREVFKNHQEASTSEDDRSFQSFVDNYVVASARDALDEMAAAAFRHGYVPIKMAAGAAISGNGGASAILRRVSRDYARLVSLLILAAENKITRTEMYRDARENISTFDITENTIFSIFPSKENWARGLYLLIAPPADFTMNRRSFSTDDDEFAAFNKTGNNQELAICFSLDWYLRAERYPILREYVVWFLGGASDAEDGNTGWAGAYSYGNLAIDVYKKFVDRRWNSGDPGEDAVGDGFDSVEEKRALHESILPHHALTSGNANLLFLNVNSGEELLKLDEFGGCTHTRVGDLHVVRVARRQCNCTGLCA